MRLSSTIAAISTPPGKGGVAVIRIAGSDALSIAEKIFRPKSKTVIKNAPRMQIYGDILYENEQIDDGLLTYFSAPNSYTGEDVVEISCHGGILLTRKVLESALISGATLAERGEFTKRAFVNGKLSLTDTEGISMLLEAESEAQIKLSKESSRSRLKSAAEDIRLALVSLLSAIYARIDYPEEDLGELTDDEVLAELEKISEKLERLMATYKTGKAISEGISAVICGKPNVGKSTLYNLLLGEDAAIVTDIPGTTRDVLEKSVSLGNVMLHLYDTAGIRGGELDRVEAIGIERSMNRIDSSELIFALFDSTRPLDAEDMDILKLIKDKPAQRIALITKRDEENSDGKIKNSINDPRSTLEKYGFSATLEISAAKRKDETLAQITDCVEAIFTDERITLGEDAVVSSARQYSALVRARAFIGTASEAYRMGLPQDAASSDVELALGAISELDGRQVAEEVVADIFSKFCVGK